MPLKIKSTNVRIVAFHLEEKMDSKYTPQENIQTHKVTLKEKEVFAWTEAQLEFLAKKTPMLNMILAKLMDRGEQAIQKIRTKTEYRQAEARVRQRIRETRPETWN